MTAAEVPNLAAAKASHFICLPVGEGEQILALAATPLVA